MTTKEAKKEILALPLEEREAFIAEIAEHVYTERGDIPEWHKDILDERTKSNGESDSSWGNVKSRLL